MYIDTTEYRELTRIVNRCGIPRPGAGQLVSYFRHLENHCGIQFLVDFLKSTKNRILRKDPHLTLSGAGRWIARLARKGRKGRKRALRICSLYGRWDAKPASYASYKKFKDAVEVTPKKVIRNLLSLTSEQTTRLFAATIYAKVDYTPLRCENTHILLENEKTKGPPELLNMEITAMAGGGQVYLDHAEYIRDIFNLNQEHEEEALEVASMFAEEESSYVGRVTALTKDGGLKHRFIANLAKGWQVAISPLAKTLKEFVRKEAMSALEDQQGAVDWMIKELQAGKRISSVDLKSATDFLPRYLYEDVLTSFITERGADLDRNFVEAFLIDMSLCTSSYYTPFKQVSIQYGTGQAMGRWTSKSQLDLTMILLAQHIGADATNCRVNGDDIIFSDTPVAKRFVKLLKTLGVPLSPTKTFINATFGEFSGVIADKYGSLDIYKARKLNVTKDPLGALRNYGPSGIRLIPRELQPYVWVVACMDDPSGIESVRSASGYPLEGIIPPTKTNFLKEESWDPKWVQEAFIKHSLHLQEERLIRVEIHLSRNGISLPDQEMLRNKILDPLVEEIDRLSASMAYNSPLMRQTFREPNQRLFPLIDNLNSYLVKTSDNSQIRGFGDQAMERLYSKIQSKRIQLVQLNPESLKPAMPISWVKRVARKIFNWYPGLKSMLT